MSVVIFNTMYLMVVSNTIYNGLSIIFPFFMCVYLTIRIL